MQAMVTKVESDAHASTAPSISEIRAQIAEYEEQKTKLFEEVQKLRHTKEVSQTALQALTQQIAAIKQAKVSLNSDHGSNVPRVRYVSKKFRFTFSVIIQKKFTYLYFFFYSTDIH